MDTVLVVGFNVRPLARSAKKAGYRVFAIDYWGDMDLQQWADAQLAVLEQQPEQRPGRPQHSTAESLIVYAQQMLERKGPVDYILVSGGFDDHLKAWRQLHSLGRLVGNSPQTLQQARDRELTIRLAKRFGANAPRSFEVKDEKQFHWGANQLELPILVKPKYGSGGFHTRIIHTEQDLDRYSARHRFSKDEPVLVQELIQGNDVSVSLLGTGDSAITLSVNRQLIGLAELGKHRTKAYCGNVVPLDAPSETIAHLANISEEICSQLKLVGSNGFDYVVDNKGVPFFMEINPRIQATIEALELVSNINVVNLHIDAWRGVLPKQLPTFKGYCTRVIVYAKTSVEILDLSNIPGVVDIPMPRSHAERGDPICTVNHVATSEADALKGAWEIVNAIYNFLTPISTSSSTE
ncbi:MAG: ATP-grasp domain-containing protein [Promethearchaeota archaeon]